MWIAFAFGSAFFAGITAVLAKIGIKSTDSNLATGIRTIVILIFSWLIVFVSGTHRSINEISANTAAFLILSGITAGLSWLCYFKALQQGNVNKVAAIDKTSTVITVVLAVILLREPINTLKGLCIFLIVGGTYLMMDRKNENTGASSGRAWMLYAFASAVFASLTSIFGKIGVENIDSNLGTAIRTAVILIMAWIVVFAAGKQQEIKQIDKKSFVFLILSGLTTGLSWLCYYKALSDGKASVVVPIDKLSIVVTALFSYFILKEKLSIKALAGLILITSGSLLIIL